MHFFRMTFLQFHLPHFPPSWSKCSLHTFFSPTKTHGLCFCLSHSTRLHDVLPLLTHTEFPGTGAYLDHSQGTDGIHVSERLHLPQSRFIATWTFPSKSNSQRRQVLGEVPQVHLVLPIFHTLRWVCERGIVTQWRARNTIPTWKDEISREGKTIYHYWSWSGTSPHINTHTHMYKQPNIHKYTKTNTHKQIQTHTPIQTNINTNKTCTHIYTHGVSAVKPSIESALQSLFFLLLLVFATLSACTQIHGQAHKIVNLYITSVCPPLRFWKQVYFSKCAFTVSSIDRAG